MKYKSDASQLRLGEKLVILNNRAIGMLTRIYNMKKACSDVKSRPQFLNDKFLDSAISHIVKKFPTIDLKRNSTAIACVDEIKSDIIKSLTLYYYTFADLLELKDAILQLLTTMDANQCKLNITLNFDLTAGYLNLVINFVSLMILLSRVEDRKIVLGLFNAAYDLLHGKSEPYFPRLGQMVIDYENPLRKLTDDLGPLNRLIYMALESLKDVYCRRNISADKQREASMLSLIASPKQMLYAAQTDTVSCEYLSLDVMDRWIIFCVTMCHKTLLNNASICDMYHRSIQHGLSIRLFRDESILILPMLQQIFEPIKNSSKILNELKELNSIAIQTCAFIHAHRRQFLRTSLKELYSLLSDQPGLLGPKILFVWMGLSFARDEILWLLRHSELWPQILQASSTKKAALKTGLNTVIIDKFLPELLYYTVELRNLVVQNSEDISRYYMDYVIGYDSPLLLEMISESNLYANLPETDAILLRSIVDSLSRVSDANTDLKALRLDWFRFQANTSLQKSVFKLPNHIQFAVAMNTAIFHLRQIDELDEMLRETSDLSIYCFYPHLFDAHLKQCLIFPVQSRFAISFPQISTHFTSSLHEMCPEELEFIVERGLISCNASLEEISQRTSDVLAQLNEDELILSKNVSPQGCAAVIAIAYQQNSGGKNSASQDVKMPGQESVRDSAHPLDNRAKGSLYLAELCHAISKHKEIHISNHTFVPQEFITQHLERLLLTNLSLYAHSSDYSETCPRRPSEVLSFLHAELNNLQILDSFMPFDITRLVNDTMLQQSQTLDSHNNETLTSIYSKWYLDVYLKRKEIVYSDHFREFANNNFDTKTKSQNIPKTEQYTDRNELRALAQLIGPLGIKHIEEKLVWTVASQISELFKIVREHRELLHVARISYDKPDKIREIVAQLNNQPEVNASSKEHRRSTVGSSINVNTIYASPSHVGVSSISTGSPIETLFQRVIIIGEMIAFRELILDALNDVMRMRVPYMMNSLDLIVKNATDEMQKINVSEMCAACGIKAAQIDLALVNAIQKQSLSCGFSDAEEHYNISCLLFVFIAVALPKLASSRQSFFRASLIATQNNSHTIPMAVNSMANALFFHRRGDIQERMREFLALASGSLLQMGVNFESMPEHRSLYIQMERLIRCSQSQHGMGLNFGLLESCFPYTLIRSAYLAAYLQEGNSTDHSLGFGYQFSQSNRKA